SQFGLSGNVWTGNVALARQIARDIYTGGVFINGTTATDPRVPVGGVKNSGYGRELSHFRAQALVNAPTVWIANASVLSGSTPGEAQAHGKANPALMRTEAQHNDA